MTGPKIIKKVTHSINTTLTTPLSWSGLSSVGYDLRQSTNAPNSTIQKKEKTTRNFENEVVLGSEVLLKVTESGIIQ